MRFIFYISFHLILLLLILKKKKKVFLSCLDLGKKITWLPCFLTFFFVNSIFTCLMYLLLRKLMLNHQHHLFKNNVLSVCCSLIFYILKWLKNHFALCSLFIYFFVLLIFSNYFYALKLWLLNSLIFPFLLSKK